MRRKKGVCVFTVENLQKGASKASDILYKNADKKTILFLSGGSTPKPLYELLAREKKLSVGAAGIVDERYGEVNHENSNEKMFKKSELSDYFKNKNIPFFGILQEKQDLKNTTLQYEKIVKNLFSRFEKRIAIMGIGVDGHTAGLPPRRVQSSSIRQVEDTQRGTQDKVQSYVTEFDNFPGEFKERITLTFKALSQMDLLIILAFGSDKKKALDLMFKKGQIGEIPARFYVRPEIAGKTLLITDQKI